MQVIASRRGFVRGEKRPELAPWSSIPVRPPQSSTEVPSLLALTRFAASIRAGIPLRRRFENDPKIVHVDFKSICTHFHIGGPKTPVLEKSTGTYDTKSGQSPRASIRSEERRVGKE